MAELHELSSQGRQVANAFMGGHNNAVSPNTLGKLQTLAKGARERVQSARSPDRYFNGVFLGPAIHQNRKMHLTAHHNMHDHLIDISTSHIGSGIREHQKIQKRAKEQFANDTFSEQEREMRLKAIDYDNRLLMKGLYNVADRRNTYRDDLFLERSDRVTNARNLARQTAKDWRIHNINRENQEILGRLIRTGSAYSVKKWEKEFKTHEHHVRMSSKVKRVKSKRVKHAAGFDASSSKEDRDSGALLPQYDHAKDRACQTYTQSRAFRINKAKHDRMVKKIERERNKKELKKRRARSATTRGAYGNAY